MKLKGKIFLVSLAAVLFLWAMPLACLANSAPLMHGEKQYAAVPLGAEKLSVEKEILTFDIPVLNQQAPDYNHTGLALTDAAKGPGTVTAEYHFFNPTSGKVNARMAFAMGEDQLDKSCRVCIDGEKIGTKNRYTRYVRGDFQGSKDAACLLDEYLKDPFFRPDLPVTKLSYTVKGVGNEDQYAVFDFQPADKEKSRFLLYGVTYSNGQALKPVRDGDQFETYLFGEADAGDCSWSVEDKSGKEHSLPVTKEETCTFLEFTQQLSGYPEDISDIDRYNIVVSGLNADGSGGIYTSSPVYPAALWYEYEFTVEPGESRVNSVTAVLAPEEERKRKVYYYTYEYLLSPAQGFDSFGPLEISIRTPHRLSDAGSYAFTQTDEGYALHLDTLPEGELSFTLTQAEAGKGVTSGGSTGSSGNVKESSGETQSGLADMIRNLLKLLLFGAVGIGVVAGLIVLIIVKTGRKKKS